MASPVSQIDFGSMIQLAVITTSSRHCTSPHRGVQQEQHQHLAQLSITFSKIHGTQPTLAPWLAVDWPSFDQLCSSRAGLTSVVIQVPNSDALEQLTTAAQYRLDHLSTSGKLEIVSLVT